VVDAAPNKIFVAGSYKWPRKDDRNFRQ